MFHVYLYPYIVGGKWSYYCGYTGNPARRWEEHRTGKGARCLRGRILGEPAVIFHPVDTRAEAMALERDVKQHWSRTDKQMAWSRATKKK